MKLFRRKRKDKDKYDSVVLLDEIERRENLRRAPKMVWDITAFGIVALCAVNGMTHLFYWCDTISPFIGKPVETVVVLSFFYMIFQLCTHLSSY